MFPSSPSPVLLSQISSAALEEAARIWRVKLLDKSSSYADQCERTDLRTKILEERREWLTMLLNRFLSARCLNHLRDNHFEDLLQEGLIALLIAIDRFDPEQCVAFGTYAEDAVIGAFKHYLRDKVGIIRESACNQEKRAQTGETAPVRVEQGDDEALDVCDGRGEFTAKVEMREAVDKAFEAWDICNANAVRARRAVYATYFEDARLADLAIEFGVSITQAHRYVKAGEARLKHFLKEQGFDN